MGCALVHRPWPARHGRTPADLLPAGSPLRPGSAAGGRASLHLRDPPAPDLALLGLRPGLGAAALPTAPGLGGLADKLTHCLMRVTLMGRSSSTQARSAVSTSAGLLRTVRARQQRSPRDRARAPSIERIAPASSASMAVSGSTVTPAAPSNCRSRPTSKCGSTIPTTSAKLAAPRTVLSSAAAVGRVWSG